MTTPEPSEAKGLLLQNVEIQYIFFEGDKRTSGTDILIDVSFELDNKNNHGFHNFFFFTQKVVFFTEL